MEVAALLRERMGLRSQRQFARELGISQGKLSLLLRGRQRLGLAVAQRLAERYPEIEDVLSGVVRPPAPTDGEAA